MHCVSGRGLDPGRSGMVSATKGRQDRRAQRYNYRWEASYPCSKEGPSAALFPSSPVERSILPSPTRSACQSLPSWHRHSFQAAVDSRFAVFRRRLHLPFIIFVSFEQGVIRPVALPGHSLQFTTTHSSPTLAITIKDPRVRARLLQVSFRLAIPSIRTRPDILNTLIRSCPSL